MDRRLELLDDGAGLHAVERRARRSRRGFPAAGCAPAFRPAGRRGRGCAASSARSVFGGAAQRVEIVAEDLERDLGAHAGQHVVEPVRDRLADIDRQRQHREAAADVGDDVGLRRVRLPRGRPRSRMSARPRHARRARRGRCAGRPAFTSGTSRMSRSAIRPTRFDSASEMPGLKQHVDGEGAFVEGRQEGARQQQRAGARGERRPAARSTPMNGAAVAKRASSSRAVGALEHAHQSQLSRSPSRFRPGSR